MRVPILALVLAVLLATRAPAQDDLLFYDFEQGADLAAYPALDPSGDVEARIVSPGADGAGHCLLVANPRPSRYDGVLLRQSFEHRKNLLLSFDYRAEIEQGKEAAYIGIIFYDTDDKQFWGSVPFQSDWRHAEVAVAGLSPTNEGSLRLGQVFHRISLYGRAQGDQEALMRVWIDSLRITTKPRESVLSDRSRVSTANPPLFDWPRSDGASRLQFSPSPDFPPDSTTAVEVSRNWHLPDAPLDPAVWYWRTWTSTPLAEGWSDIERLEIPPEAHRFRAAPLPVAELAERPHPRLLDAQRERAALDDAALAALVGKAEALYKQGVPDDCPVWVEGDPRWPTWIDWYGKAHGGITSRTGRRLEDLGRLCAITGDERVRQWTRELALKAAAWDPDGGSAMSRGDIGAHHFLRGLNWCYDALHDYLPDDERARLRDIIIRRAGRFWDRLNPFRGSAENNHAWLQTYGLAECGVVLLGEHPEAEQWLTYSLDLYVGRFLCALGYQGDNNEGISYWDYGLYFVTDFADMMREVCGVDLYAHPWLAQTARFPMYCAPPGAWAVSFADTSQPNHGVRGPACQGRVGELAVRTRDPYALWYSGAREPVEGLEPRPPVDLPQSIWYRYIGWAIFNTSLVDGRDGVTFALRSGPFYAGHQHEDLNAFVLHAYGEKLALDGGHYDWYGSAHFKGYSTLTRAHNSILVNGQDQGSRKAGADGRIAAYFDSPGYGYVVGDVSDPDVYAGRVTRFDRRVLFVKPGYVVIHDLLAAAQGPARWDWLLHTAADIRTDAANRAFAVTSGEASLSGRFLAPTDVSLQVTKGYPVEPVDRYSTNPLPPERYVDEWTLTATPAQERAEEDLLVVLRVSRGEGRPVPARSLDAQGACAALVEDEDGTTHVLSRRRDAEGPMRADGMVAQGEMAAVTLAADGVLRRAFLARGTSLTVRGTVILHVSAPADLALLSTPDGKLLSLSAAGPVRVAVACGASPAKVLLNGRPARAAFSADEALLALEVPAGEHELAYGPRPERVISHALPPLALRAADRTQALSGYARRRAEDLRCHYWGAFDAPRADRYRLAPVGGDEAQVLLTVDGRPVPADASLWLTQGRHWATVTATAELEALSLRAEGVEPRDAEMLEASFKPDADALVFEAEAVAAEGEVKGKAMEKVAASGGVAHCVWDTVGQWAEWALTVPAAGRYTLLIRGAGEADEVLRALSLDGKPLFERGGIVRLHGTGGWCRTENDWRYFRVPVVLELSAGEHRLRMEQLGGSMNLDLFALCPLAE